MENTKKQIFKVLVTRNDCWQVLKVSSEFLYTDLVPRLDVVPAPNELVESLLFRFFIANDLRMTLCIINFANLL